MTDKIGTAQMKKKPLFKIGVAMTAAALHVCLVLALAYAGHRLLGFDEYSVALAVVWTFALVRMLGSKFSASED